MKTIVATLALFGLTMASQAQEKTQDSIVGKKVVLDEAFVSAIRVTNQAPVTFSNLTKEQIQPRNLGQDIPILMNFLPSVVTTSDAGAGVGYTGIRVRGSDATRVNVTINGIPYNDAESHGTFWVNMPDFASSTESLQLQRGVGTSTNGAGAFGASLNVLTDGFSEDAYAQIASSVGSFNTFKSTLKFSTGLLNEHIEITGRLSKISSDGYIDRASSNLDSYFLQGAYKDDNTLIKGLLFGGHEITYQSWNGVDAATLETNRTFNSAGLFTDENGDTQFYEKEEDNYKQDHVQLLWNEKINRNWSTNFALHYTRGRGYFEQYKEDEDFETYGFTPIKVDTVVISKTDIIRRRWLDNDFYGTVFSANYVNDKLNFIIGGGYNSYNGDHFGEVIWAQYASNSNIRDRYYDTNSTKTDFNIYTKVNHTINEKWRLFGDLQYRAVRYKANGEETGLVDDKFNFFNPKAGITYDINQSNNLYFSYAVANREPNRNDYESGNPASEKLNDFELGWRYVSSNVQVSTNAYYMGYKNQLVLTGDIDDVGEYKRVNVPQSYRAGLEVDASIMVSDKLMVKPNVAVSTNKIKDFILERDGVINNIGDTNIAFSPTLVAGNVIQYQANEKMSVSLLSKYVGEQYLSNTDTQASKLNAYFVNDINVTYEIKPKSIVKSIVFSGLINNILNEKYESNGYTYLDFWSDPDTSKEIQGYYPQAGTNFLLGAIIHF